MTLLKQQAYNEVNHYLIIHKLRLNNALSNSHNIFTPEN